MNKFKDVKVIYSNPAQPPLGLKLNVTYTIDFDGKYYVKDLISNSKVYVGLDLIKALFSPINKSWDDLEVKEVKDKIVEKEDNFNDFKPIKNLKSSDK